jgi:excisionase family DNA binding protein
MLHKLIDAKILADYLRSQQAMIEEIIRDQKDREEKSRLASEDEKMLTAKEAATRLACSEDWLYRNAKKLPFAKKLGPKNLRFSKTGLEKWLQLRNVN